HQRVHPQIPRGEKSPELTEADFGPLVESAFERQPAAEIDHYRGLRQIEQQNGEKPEGALRFPQPRRDADPRGADDVEQLRENEIAERERTAERRALLLDLGEGSAHTRAATVGGGAAWRGRRDAVVTVRPARASRRADAQPLHSRSGCR